MGIPESPTSHDQSHSFSHSTSSSILCPTFLGPPPRLPTPKLHQQIIMASQVAQASSTCCGKATGGDCVCGKSFTERSSQMDKHSGQREANATSVCTAQQAKCSCGKEKALNCSCDKAASENTVAGARCSCHARPAGQCNCDRSGTENAPVAGSTCACGSRPADACTCEKSTTGGAANPNETDFTTKK